MKDPVSRFRGCLLGLAVGDAMGHIVDEKSWQDIQEDYGPNGLLGYDLVNGCAAGSAYTQVAAFAANGFLLGITRGKPELYVPYINLSLREWARAQHFPRDPEKSYCWVAKIQQMRVRRCKDSRMLDALRIEAHGTMEKPTNRASTPGSLPVAAVAGIVCSQKNRHLAPSLGAQTVALTHGNVETFLTGGILAECIAAVLEDPQAPLQEVFRAAIEKTAEEFLEKFPQVQQLADSLRRVIHSALQGADDPRQEMEKLTCDTAAQCLQGAMYACLVFPEDFDSAMILAVNHSGRSAAVGCLVGAVLGARMGVEALPEFYLECLEPAPVLEELAQDLALGSPTAGLFDDDWDHKYVQGMPLCK